VDSFSLFFNLYSIMMRQGVEDNLVCSKRGLFEIKSFYFTLSSHDSAATPRGVYGSSWVRVDYASTGGGSLYKLEMAFWEFLECSGMWCILRERNSRSSKDCERTMVELKAFFFKALYQWTTAHNCLLISNLLDFLDLVFF
jgi:hypothetical protein